ncbi:MAG: hypothetical protein BWZ10_00369 [candidate division BRC1 bacterium ADurb.BinA364]|nr:MAG: hypothetical protein BWZ10_00369 [candidate division BRC1 bacterium ADurb.BinA364]
MQPRLAASEKQVERGALGQVEQGAEFQRAFGLEGNPFERRIPIVADVLVKLLEFVFGDILGVAGPDGFHRVQGLILDDFPALAAGLGLALVVAFDFFALDPHLDRIRDVVGVFAHDLADGPLGRKIGQAVLFVGGLEPERDCGAGLGAFGGLQGVSAVAFGFPFDGGVFARPAGRHHDLVGGHEAGIEADAELADQFRRQLRFLGFAQQLGEFLGSGLGDRADVADHLVAAHADAVVRYGQGTGVLVDFDANMRVARKRLEILVGERFEAQAVQGVGGVGNQFAQENFLVGIDRVDHQIEQLPGLGLELPAFDFAHGRSSPLHWHAKGCVGLKAAAPLGQGLVRAAFGDAGPKGAFAANPKRSAPHRLYSGRMCGNKITSRIDGESVSSIASRSMPIPRPLAGGMPYSSARM